MVAMTSIGLISNYISLLTCSARAALPHVLLKLRDQIELRGQSNGAHLGWRDPSSSGRKDDVAREEMAGAATLGVRGHEKSTWKDPKPWDHPIRGVVRGSEVRSAVPSIDVTNRSSGWMPFGRPGHHGGRQ